MRSWAHNDDRSITRRSLVFSGLIHELMSNSSVRLYRMNIVKGNRWKQVFFWSTQQWCKVERSLAGHRKADYGDSFTYSCRSCWLGLEEIRWRLTYCKGILVDAATGCIFPRLRSNLQESFDQQDCTASDSLHHSSVGGFNVSSQANPIGIGVGFNEGHPETHRCTNGEDNKTMATYWCSGLTSIRQLPYIKLQRLLQSHFTFAPWLSIHLRPLLLIRPYQTSRSPTTESPFEAFPALPRHLFPSRYLPS